MLGLCCSEDGGLRLRLNPPYGLISDYRSSKLAHQMETYADLLDCIDLSLHSDAYSKDVRRAADIGIELCELVRSELDPTQVTALRVAKRFWEGNASEQSEFGTPRLLPNGWIDTRNL